LTPENRLDDTRGSRKRELTRQDYFDVKEEDAKKLCTSAENESQSVREEHGNVGDVSTEPMDEVKLSSDVVTEAADEPVLLSSDAECTEQELSDEKDDTAASDVPDEGEKVMLVVTDVWRPLEETEASSSHDATELDEREEESSVHEKEATLDDDVDNASLPPDLVAGKDDSREDETAVREAVKYLVDQVAPAENDVSEIDHSCAAVQSAVGAVEKSREATMESVGLSERSFFEVGSDDTGTALLVSPEVDSSVNDKKATASEDRLSSYPPVDDNSKCIDEKIEHTDEPACLPSADEVAASISDFLTGTSVSDDMGAVSELHDVDDQYDTVSDEPVVLSSDAEDPEQEPSIVQLMQQADGQSSATCDADHSSSDQEATEKVEVGECLMPLAEDESSKGSTLSYGSSGAVKESSNVGCADGSTPAGNDVLKESGCLSVDPEAESAEPSMYLSSGDQHDVPSVIDYHQVSESVEEEHGDDAEASLQPASEDVAAGADDDDEDFEIDLL